jgi:hypothetical protein
VTWRPATATAAHTNIAVSDPGGTHRAHVPPGAAGANAPSQ